MFADFTDLIELLNRHKAEYLLHRAAEMGSP